MYIEKKDFENYEILLTQSYYPHETVVLELNEHDMYMPTFVRVTDFLPKENQKVNILVADNGYVLTQVNKTMVVGPNSYSSDSLENIIKQFLNHEVETERNLTDSEFEDDELLAAIGEMNGHYQNSK